MQRIRVRDLPQISASRVEELARHGPERGAGYERVTPPVDPSVRQFFEKFPTIDKPTGPCVIVIWQPTGRPAYVGGSRNGLGSAMISAQRCCSRRDATFDRLTVLPVSGALVELATSTLKRLLKPKFNRVPCEPLDGPDQAQRDQEVLRLLGLPRRTT